MAPNILTDADISKYDNQNKSSKVLTDADIQQYDKGQQGSYDFSQMYQTQDEGDSPLNPIQRGAVSIPEQFESKKKLLNEMGFKNVEQGADNRIYISGKPLDPRPHGFTQFLRDSLGDLGDMVGPAIPIVGQIGADIAATPSIAATGFSAAPAYAAVNAAGAAGGELARQGLSNAMTGEQFNPGEVGSQALWAGGTAGTVTALTPAVKGAASFMGRAMGKVANKLGDVFPDTIKTMFDVKPAAVDHVFEGMKSGRKLPEIVNEITKKPEFATNAADRFMFGGSNEMTHGNFINQFKRNINGSEDEASANVIRDFTSQHFGLSPRTLEQMESLPARDLLSNEFTSPASKMNKAGQIISALENGEKNAGTDVRNSVMKAIKENKDKIFNIKDHLTDFFSTLGQEGMGGRVLKPYESGSPVELEEWFKSRPSGKFTQEVLNLFKTPKLTDLEAGTYGKSAQKLFYKTEFTPQELLSLNGKLRTLSHQAFDTNALGGTNASQAFYGLKTALSKKISTLSTEVEKANLAYSHFEELAPSLKGMRQGGFEGQRAMGNFLDKAFQDSNERVMLQDAQRYTKYPIIETVDKLGAAGELKAVDLPKKQQAFLNVAKDIFNKDDRFAPVKDILTKLDSSLPNGSKFLKDIKDHVAAEEFTKPQNFFRGRALYYFISSALGFPVGGPIGSLATVAALPALNPNTMAKVSQIGKNIPKVSGASSNMTRRGLSALSGVMRQKK